MVDPGGPRFLCRIDFVGVARDGLTLSQPLWHLYRVEAGRVVRQDAFDTEQEALDALADAADATG